MSGTNYIASNWRTPTNQNSSKNDNYSLDFNGSSDFISCGDDPQIQLTGDISISAWFKTTSTGTMIVAAKRDSPLGGNTYGWQIYCSLGKVVFLVTRSGPTSTSVNGGTTISDGEWHHVLCTINQDSQIAIILDGATEGTTSLPAGTFIDSNTDLRIGYNQVGSQHYYFNGEISEVALFDYLVSGATLYGDATSGAGNPMALKPTPVGYWPLGDNSASDPLAQPNVAVEDASVFDFDGSNDYIKLNSPMSTSGTDWSISCWFKSSQSGGNKVFVGYTGAYYFGLNWNRLTFFSSDNSFDITSVLSVNDGAWHNIVFTYNYTSGAWILYIDGSVDTSQIATTGVNIPSWNFFGARSSTQYFADCELNGIAYFNTELSEPNVTSIYNSGVPGDLSSLNPTAWWKLDESANWEADTVGAWQIPDAVSEFPQSFDFDGTNDEINAGDILHNDGQTPMSLSAWVNITNTGDYAIASKKKVRGAPLYLMEGWDISIDSSGLQTNRLEFNYVGLDSGGSSIGYLSKRALTFSISDGLWHHVIVTYDGSESATGVKFYIDGVEDTLTQTLQDTLSGNSPNDPTVDFKIGTASRYGGSDFYNGKMSNVQIWDVALDQPKVTTLYNGGTPTLTPPNQSDLKGSWKLDNTATFSTNWTVPDASGNGNNGTSSGMTEQSLVNNNVSTLNGESSGMTSGNLVLSDLTRNLPYENYSLDFDGGLDYIALGNITTLSNASTFTYSGWYNQTTLDVISFMYGSYIDASNWVGIYTWSDGLMNFQINNVGLNTYARFDYSTAVTAGQWFHLAVVYDGLGAANADKVKLYIDGALITLSFIGTFPFITPSGVNNSTIGKMDSFTQTWNGKISNTAIWNNSLSSTEVQDLYANGMPQDLTTFTPQPINWWTLGKESFWDGTDWVIRDMIGTNDGLSANMGVSELKGDAPRSEANGVGTNIAVPTDLKGNAGWSDKNGYSINMSSTARKTDTP